MFSSNFESFSEIEEHFSIELSSGFADDSLCFIQLAVSIQYPECNKKFIKQEKSVSLIWKLYTLTKSNIVITPR